ncbi:hypothetical protein HPB48_004218 [Haemaphysalis longicornis]|uniref:Peptidase M13 C-terminal domain-containing protein n=1 Tax=Haemaphysalis longicornis TaxID=44386 RepID=A0A9J6GED2_HAELO|nr:hypothetical protein HPB48_004218 [Haemaphysalis longicornis]
MYNFHKSDELHSPSEGHCSELSPRGVCSTRVEAAERFKVYLTGAIIAAVALIVFILTLPLGGRPDWGDGVCATPDCIRHALVLGILDGSRDNDSVPGPCDDFGTFVCKAARNRYGRLAADIVSQMILDWAARLRNETSCLGTSSDSFSKPAALMQACMLCTGCGKARVERLVEFVANRSFAWPTIRDYQKGNALLRYNYATSLRALVELSVEWALPLWFRLELSPPSHLRGRRVVRILPSPMPPLWDAFHQDLLSAADAYVSYLWCYNASILRMREPSQHYYRFLAERSAGIQRNIFETLKNATAVAVPFLVPLRNLTSFVRGVTVANWLTILQSAYAVTPNVSEQDFVLLANERFLAAMDRIFTTHAPWDIFYHTTWWFLQALGPFASDEVFSFLNSDSARRLFLRTMCTAQSESVYYDSLAAINKDKFTEQQRHAISIHLRNVRTVAVEKVSSLEKISNASRDALSVMREQTIDFIWPQKDLELKGSLRMTNASTVDYFNEWVESRRPLHDPTNASESLADAAKIFRLDARHVTSYDPLSNVISVSVAALDSPLFYLGGTSAMTYGGLGFIYASAVLKALDTAMLIGGGDGVFATTDTTSRGGLRNLLPCVHTDLAFPELPALRVAYEAYARFRNATTDLPLKGLANYSAEQVFFLTFCHSTCEFRESGSPESPRCNEAVTNFEPFEKAFNCPSDSKISNSTNCSPNF